MDEERLPSGFRPAWSTWLPEGTGTTAHAETGERRLLEHGPRCRPEGVDGGGETRPRSNGQDYHAYKTPGSDTHRRAAHLDQPHTGGIPEARAGRLEGSSETSREQAPAEARALEDEVTEASRAKDSPSEESPEHAQSEGMRLREQAAADARQILADAEKMADFLTGQARSDADWVRDLAISEAERMKSAILEHARKVAEAESARLREQAVLDAEEASAHIVKLAEQDAERIRAEARQEKLDIIDEAEEKAAADVRQILADAEKTADALAGQARSDANRVRDLAISEAERVKSAILDHAREVAGGERARLREQAVLDADEAKAQTVELAEQDAERIRAEALQEKLDILDEAEEEAVRLHLEAAASAGTVPADDSGTTLLRARDVGSREFPQARHGFDPESVRRWLKIVETSYRLLEEELQRARREWERALEVLEVTRLHLGHLAGSAGQSLQPALQQRVETVWGAWEQSMQGLYAIERPRPAYDLPSLLVRASRLEQRLDKRMLGYSRPQVQHLLDELTAELARLEHQVGSLAAENDELRGRLLTQLSRPTRENMGILRLLPPEAVVSRPALGVSPASTEAGPSSGASVELDLLEHQVGALRAENDELKGRLLTQVSRPAIERLVVLGLLPPDAVKETSALGATPSSNGTETKRDQMVG